jgi:hypothetical protein
VIAEVAHQQPIQARTDDLLRYAFPMAPGVTTTAGVIPFFHYRVTCLNPPGGDFEATVTVAMGGYAYADCLWYGDDQSLIASANGPNGCTPQGINVSSGTANYPPGTGESGGNRTRMQYDSGTYQVEMVPQSNGTAVGDLWVSVDVNTYAEESTPQAYAQSTAVGDWEILPFSLVGSE